MLKTQLRNHVGQCELKDDHSLYEPQSRGSGTQMWIYEQCSNQSHDVHLSTPLGMCQAINTWIPYKRAGTHLTTVMLR